MTLWVYKNEVFAFTILWIFKKNKFKSCKTIKNLKVTKKIKEAYLIFYQMYK